MDGYLAVANCKELKFTTLMKNEVSDEQLMLLYARGDTSAFERLYEKHKGGLFRYCLRQLSNRAKAEECFQDVWMKLINSRENYQPKALFTTYLYRIAQNHVIDLVRKERKTNLETELDDAVDYAESSEKGNEVSGLIIQNDKYLKLRTEIEGLPLEQKTALLLKLDAGLSLEEISVVIGCGKETVKSRLRYAMAKLKDLLGELA